MCFYARACDNQHRQHYTTLHGYIDHAMCHRERVNTRSDIFTEMLVRLTIRLDAMQQFCREVEDELSRSALGQTTAGAALPHSAGSEMERIAAGWDA